MPSFALQKITSVSPPINTSATHDFYELVIDGVRPFKEFRDSIGPNDPLMNELGSIFNLLQKDARGEPLNGTQKHDLDGQTEGGKEFEYKTKHLRVYAFKHELGKIVISVVQKEAKGKKQDNDIVRFRNLKKEFLKSYANGKGRII